MYKVFFKQSFFLLTDDRNLIKKSEGIHIFTNIHELRSIVHTLIECDSPFHTTLFHSDIEELFTAFKSLFTFVHAAGGAVVNNHALLSIIRMGMLDLPKGHLEENEDIMECAIREVEEECGVGGLTILSPLPSTYHIYPFNGQWRLKQSHWFIMSASYTDRLIPQTEEGIEQVFWLPIQDIPTHLQATFPSLTPVFESVYATLS